MTDRSPLHPLALTLDEIKASEKMMDVIMFELDGEEAFRVSSFGMLGMEKGREGRPPFLSFDEEYDSWARGSVVSSWHMEVMGLIPFDSSYAKMDDEVHLHNGRLRDPHNPKVVWSICFAVRREIAHEVLPVERLQTSLEECVAREVALLEEEARDFDEQLAKAYEEGLL